MSVFHRNCSACNHTEEKVEDSMKPSKAKDILDIRMVPGHPNHAWIECYNNSFDLNAQVGIAEDSAAKEFIKMKEIQASKEAKLQQFQNNVSKRVQCLQKLKRIEEQKKAMQLIEDEELAISQRILGMKIPYKGDTECLKALNKELLKSCIVPSCKTTFNQSNIELKNAESSKEYLRKLFTEKLNTSKAAKARLLSKKLDLSTTQLPGGLWDDKLSTNSKDTSVAVYPPANKTILNKPIPQLDTWTGINTIQPLKDLLKDSNTNPEKTLENTNILNITSLAGKDIYTAKENSGEEEENEGVQNQNQKVYDESFDVGWLQRNLVYDEALIAQDNDKKQKQLKSQYWKFRQLFMDIEREQVREKKRQQIQKKNIQKIKIDKEETRAQIERKNVSFNSHQIFSHLPQHLPDNEKVNHGVRRQNLSTNKEKEFKRYLEALRAVAMERVTLCHIKLPMLCQCGDTFWDSHPDKCANNCVFYKNPKGYVKALTSVLTTTR